MGLINYSHFKSKIMLNSIVLFLITFFSPFPTVQRIFKDLDNSFIQNWETEVMNRIALCEADCDWSDYSINWDI